jgi:VIT1/CCC1 family predicted Fe2+/Mn2+ transporter
MEKVNADNPAIDELIDSKESSTQESFILKSIAASFAGASIPAAIFYFLM